MENTETTRNQTKLINDGYMYVFDKMSADASRKFWRCDRKADKCCGRIHTTLNNEYLCSKGNHNHEPDGAGTEVAKIKASIKRRAEETVETPAQIRNTVLDNTGPAIQGRMPNKDATRKSCQRVRNIVAGAPPAPINLETLIIPESYKRYEFAPGQTENFLLADTASEQPDPQRILIYGRESNIQWNEQMKNIFIDGTFRQAPPLFYQIFVILANRGGFVLPILYALLPNKHRETYGRLFQLIKDMWPQFEPETISLDYELAVINSVTEAFPAAQLNGCLFHLVKNFKKQIRENGLYHRYTSDHEFSLQARMVIAIAFVPIGEIDNALQELSQLLPVELIPILNWLEDNYVGRLNRNQTRRRPLFSPHIWNVYDRVLNDQNRTNNIAEAAHRSLQSQLDMDHPSIWKFVDGLRSVQKGKDALYEEFTRGEAPPQKRLKYQAVDTRIKRIVESYGNRTISEYLRGIAHNVLMN